MSNRIVIKRAVICSIKDAILTHTPIDGVGSRSARAIAIGAAHVAQSWSTQGVWTAEEIAVAQVELLGEFNWLRDEDDFRLDAAE